MKLIISVIFACITSVAYADAPRIMVYGGPLCSRIWDAKEADDMFVATHDFNHFPATCKVVASNTKVELIDKFGWILKVYADGQMWFTTERYALFPQVAAELNSMNKPK